MIHFATDRAHAALTVDDRLAVAALAERGVPVQPLAWDQDHDVPAAGDVVVVRSCWDYHLRPDAFRAWLDRLSERGCAVFNPLDRLRWNLDKRYLLELQQAGATIPRTVFIPKGQAFTPAEVFARLGTHDAVVKPAISLSAHQTWRTKGLDGPALARALGEQSARQDLLVQAFVPRIVDGEVSLVFFGSRYSHAVVKVPRPGDFRVQADFGATHAPFVPDPSLVDQARRILRLAGGDVLYARVDGVPVDGELVLMELELIDPVLFFGHGGRGAAAGFAAALVEAAGLQPGAAGAPRVR